MDNMLRHIVYTLLFLLFTLTVGRNDYVAESPVRPSATSCYRQQQSPCKKTMDFLFTNRFADMPQLVLPVDNGSTSKFKYIARTLAALNELKKQERQTNHIVCHALHSLYTDAVDYYIYALRRIIV